MLLVSEADSRPLELVEGPSGRPVGTATGVKQKTVVRSTPPQALWNEERSSSRGNFCRG